jgi:hypothetical protein
VNREIIHLNCMIHGKRSAHKLQISARPICGIVAKGEKEKLKLFAFLPPRIIRRSRNALRHRAGRGRVIEPNRFIIFIFAPREMKTNNKREVIKLYGSALCVATRRKTPLRINKKLYTLEESDGLASKGGWKGFFVKCSTCNYLASDTKQSIDEADTQRRVQKVSKQMLRNRQRSGFLRGARDDY